MMRRTLLLLFALAVALLSTRAAAQQTSDPAAATELFKQGRDAIAHGDLAGACAKFSESLRLDTKVGTLLNLADCEEKLGQLANARAHLVRAIDLARAENDDRIGFAESRLAAIDQRVPRLTVTLAAGAPADTTVTRDGILLTGASLGTALPANAGKHVVIASASGRQSRTYDLDLAESDTRVLEVEPGMAEPIPPPPVVVPAPASSSPSSPPSSSFLRPAGFVAGAAGAAFAIAGGVTALVALQTNASSKASCDAANVCDAHDKALRDAARTEGDAATVLFIAAGVLVATGVVLVLASPKPRPKSIAWDLVVRF